ncbi:MAG: cysteine desulfurase family protein [Bacillota bacterium]
MTSQGSSDMVYMDNSSTTKPDPTVVAAMMKVLTQEFGNPSSLHRLGARAEELVRQSRQSVAALMCAREEEVFFTSGGTEANNWAITASVWARGQGCHVVSTTVEHPSVMSTLEHLKDAGYAVTLVPVDCEGKVDPAEVLSAVTPQTALVSVMLVQNEVGTIEPIGQIGKGLSAMRGRRPRFHVDATQGFARLPIDVGGLGIDLMSLSAHKIHGPKGIGALYVKKGFDIPPLLYGGGQERGYRSGTENMPGIAGLGAACDLWAKDRSQVLERLARLREDLVAGVRDAAPHAVLHGASGRDVAPYIVHFSFPGYRGESILHALEQRGVFVSTGSACSAHKAKPSPVVLALGGSEEDALGAVRFSLSRYSTQDDVDRAVGALDESLKELAAWRRERGGSTASPIR